MNLEPVSNSENGEISMTFISMHNSRGYFINKEKKLREIIYNEGRTDPTQTLRRKIDYRLTQETYLILEGFAMEQAQRRQQNERD